MACLLWLAAGGPDVFAQKIQLFQRGYLEGGTGAATTLTDAAVAAFEAGHPGIEVAVVGVPWGREGDLKLRTALLARRRIDVFRVAHDQLPSFVPRRGTLLAPADAFLTDGDREDFGPALEALTIDGQVLAWPLWSTAIVMIGNPALMDRLGIVPPEDRQWGWWQFERVLETIREADSVDGLRVHGLHAASRPPLFEWSPLLMAHCGDLFDHPTVEEGMLGLSPGLPWALEEVHRWREAGYFAPGFGIDDTHAAQQSFLDGRVVFLMSSPGFIRASKSKGVLFEIIPPPTGTWGQATKHGPWPLTTGALGCFAVVDSGDEARIAAGHALARYLTSAEVAEAVPGWYLAPPARTSVTSFYDDPAYAPLREILPTARYMTPPLGGGFMETTVVPEFQAAVLGERTAAEAVARIEAAARRRMLD